MLLDALEEVSGSGKPIELQRICSGPGAEDAEEGMQLLQACGIKTSRTKSNLAAYIDDDDDIDSPGIPEVKSSHILGDDRENIFEVKAAKKASKQSGSCEREDRVAAVTVQTWWRARKHKKVNKLLLAAEALIMEHVRGDSIDLQRMLSDTSFDCYNPANMDPTRILRAMHYGFTKPHNFILRYEINLSALGHWTEDISKKYMENPYHNWNHAFDVYQFCHMSVSSGLIDFMNYQDVFAILIAAIAHDVGHPGKTNPFLIATKADLAIQYNDRSPLENMHASTCFETMTAQARNNFLSTLDDATRANVRTKIITAILATDNKHHFEMVDKFKTRVSKEDSPFTQGSNEDREKQITSKEDRRLLLQAFMHMCDISNCCRPFSVFRRVSGFLEAEFFKQGDAERSLGIPISMLMDRTKDSLAASQGFWINHMVGPLFKPWSNFAHQDYRQTLKDNMDGNAQGWAELIEKHGKKTAGEILHLEGCVGFE